MKRHSGTVKMLLLGGFVIVAGSFVGVMATNGESAPAGPPSRDEMSTVMEAMTPMYGRMAEGMMEASLNVLARPETAERMATFTKDYYDALVAKGFSDKDALKIVVSAGVPRAQGVQ